MSNSDAEKAVMVSQIEMEYRVELFNKMVGSCFQQCVDKKYREGDLNLGESSCVDRCTHKYWQATAIVGQLLGMQAAKNS